MLLLLALGCAAFAQTEPKDPEPKDQDQSQPQEQQDIPTFKANVNVVNIFFTVRDKHGTLMPSFTKDDFQLFEDGKLQTIKYFNANSDLPLTIGILIDTSGSQMRAARRVMPKVAAAPAA